MLKMLWEAGTVYINGVKATNADLSKLSYDYRRGKVWVRHIVKTGDTVKVYTAA